MISLTLIAAQAVDLEPAFSVDLVNNVTSLYHQLSNFNSIYTTHLMFMKLDKEHKTPVLDETMEYCIKKIQALRRSLADKLDLIAQVPGDDDTIN